MPGKLRSGWIAPIIAMAALLSLPVVAQATLTYTRNPLNPVVYVAADNGSGAHRIGPGRAPRVLPDGQTIAYLREGPGHAQELVLAPSGGGDPRRLMPAWQETSSLAFSPDSKTIAALRGAELGSRNLVLLDVATGAKRTVAAGYFSGFSFSPAGDELVYSRAGSEKFPLRSDLYRVATAGGEPVRITHDQRSQSPLWGPTGKIVFVKLLGAKQRKYAPKNELYLMNPDGSQQKRLTHTKVGALLLGLVPTEWSADGRRLLTEFEGQDTSYAVAVNPRTGAQKPIDRVGEQGFVGTALSADGQRVLGFTGGFEPGPGHDVVCIPYAGGKAQVLAKNAFDPDWSS